MRNSQVAFGGFLVTIPPLLWLYHQHSVLRIPGGELISSKLLEVSGLLVSTSVYVLCHVRVVIGHLGCGIRRHGSEGVQPSTGELNESIFSTQLILRTVACDCGY